MEPNWSLEFAGFDQQKAAWKGLPWELCSSLHCWQWSMDLFCLCIAQKSQMWLHLYSLQHKTQSIVKSSQGTCEVLKLEKWKDAAVSFSVYFPFSWWMVQALQWFSGLLEDFSSCSNLYFSLQRFLQRKVNKLRVTIVAKTFIPLCNKRVVNIVNMINTI